MTDRNWLQYKPRKKFEALLLTAFLAMMALPAHSAPKTDIVIFKNGDKLTGEFKQLQRGRLSLNTDATGTISIEWDKIAYIVSNQNVQVETSSGARYFGHLAESEKSGRVVVDTVDGLQMLDSQRVILMAPIEDEGLSALDVDLTVGYNFAKAGGVTQGTIGVDAKYRTQKRQFGIGASSTVNDSDTQAASERKNFNVDYKRLWSKRWYAYGDVTFDQNDELDLDLRSSLGGGWGRFVIQSNNMLLELAAGLQFSNESIDNEPEDTKSIEGKLTFNWDWFRFDDPELDWSTQFVVFPNLSEPGRVRANFDTSLQWEMINDLKWGIAIYSTYDNKPQNDDSATTDYGINTTLTYEF